MIPSRSDEGCSLAAFFVREVWSLLKFKDYDYRYPQDGATQVRKMDLQENKRNALRFTKPPIEVIQEKRLKTMLAMSTSSTIH